MCVCGRSLVQYAFFRKSISRKRIDTFWSTCAGLVSRASSTRWHTRFRRVSPLKPPRGFKNTPLLYARNVEMRVFEFFAFLSLSIEHWAVFSVEMLCSRRFSRKKVFRKNRNFTCVWSITRVKPKRFFENQYLENESILFDPRAVVWSVLRALQDGALGFAQYSRSNLLGDSKIPPYSTPEKSKCEFSRFSLS